MTHGEPISGPPDSASAPRSRRSLVPHGCRRAYRASILTPHDDGSVHYLERGLLLVDGRGVIDDLIEGEAAPSDCIVHELPGSLIVPGFVDTHVHYPQTRVIGSASGPLLDWLAKTIFPEESKFESEAYAKEVAVEFSQRCAAAGTTTVGAYSSSHQRATEVLFETLEETGLRAVIGLVLMERGCPEGLAVGSEAAMRAVRVLAERFHGMDRGRLQLAITPRFALSCSRESMEAAARTARELDLAIQTHIAEHPREGAATLEAHPYASDYLGVYEAVGLIGPRTILAHAIHLSDSEWDRVAAKNAKIAHCPDSNAFLGSGHMPIDQALSRGIVVGLGSDVAAGRTFDLRRAIAYAYDNALATQAQLVDMAALFSMATLGGARVLGLERHIGALSKGRDADFVVLKRPSYAAGREGALRCATFASDLAPVTHTFVRGALVHRAPTMG